MTTPHRVVIIGGGFAGLNAARALRRSPVEVTLVDRRNFHLFQPLLYQAATGGLSPADLSAPLREVLKRQTNARVLMSEVTGIDLDARRVDLSEGTLDYDTLVVAAGARHHYFGNERWEELAPGLKEIEDATEIRSRVLQAFERAELSQDPEEQARLLTFVIVGAGPTGVELAGAIGELARYTLDHEFDRIRPESARILLVEGADRVLLQFVEPLAAKAHRALEALGVHVLTSTRVEAVDPRGVTLIADGDESRVEAGTVLWAAGVKASPLAGRLAEASGAPLDRSGRIEVLTDLTLPNHPEVFVLGDMALALAPDGKPLPGIAPVAMQQGRFAADCIRRRLRDAPPRPFRYRDRGQLAVIGRASAVADLGWARFSGYPAWLLWLFVHIMYLVGFENRLLVLFQWAYSYLTRGRGARLIANASEQPEPRIGKEQR